LTDFDLRIETLRNQIAAMLLDHFASNSAKTLTGSASDRHERSAA
jgi:hypothetical protein